MRPVNLLPQSARPYVASGKAGNGSYILIGVLVWGAIMWALVNPYRSVIEPASGESG